MIYNPDNSIDSIFQGTTHEKEAEPKSLKEIFLDFKEKISEKAESLNEQFKSLTSSIKDHESIVEEIQEMDELNSKLETLTSETEEDLWDLWEEENEDITNGETISNISNNESSENLPPWLDPNFPKPPEDGDEYFVTTESIVEEESDDSSNWWDSTLPKSPEDSNANGETISSIVEDDSSDWWNSEDSVETNDDNLDYYFETVAPGESKYWRRFDLTPDSLPSTKNNNEQEYPTIPKVEKHTPVENYTSLTGKDLVGGFAMYKVGKQMGSNEGGLYTNVVYPEEKQGLFYVKFYEDPNQGHMENVANAIYRKLGVQAPESDMVIIGGRVAFVSKIIEGHTEMDRESMRSSDSVKKGFVADAFLANWDVIGLEFDNILRGSDGKPYRIDNGGALTFRARGALKEYSSNNIPELDSLLNPNINPNSAFVFEGLTEEEIRQQAQDLVYNLSERTIKNIVSNENLPKEIEEDLITRMVGRRNFLISKYNLETECVEKTEIEGDGITRLIKALNIADHRKSDEEKLFGYCGMQGDKSSIEGHQIDIIATPDGYNIYLKITSEHRRNSESESPVPARNGGNYSFRSAKDRILEVNFNSFDVNLEHTTVSLAAPHEENKAVRGAVVIKVRGGVSSQQAAEEVNEAMKILGIPDSLETPDSESVTNYARNRYKWWQNIAEGDEIGNEWSNLVLQEVFPGYETFVDITALDRFTEKHNLLLIHQIHNPENIVGILKEGMMSSHERYKRGLIIEGMSTMEDFRTGGADSVFTRLVSEFNADQFNTHGYTLIINPYVLGRTDWYGYPYDKYGVSEGPVFDGRYSADDFVERESEARDHWANEIMFRKGISTSMFMGICVPGDYYKNILVEKIKSELGIEEINGIPLEDFIVVTNNVGDYYRIRNFS